VRLDEARFGRGGFQIMKNGIEPLDVADLQDAVFLLRNLNQLGGLRGIVGHRLFDQDVPALLEQLFRDLKMSRGGRDNVERVAGSGGFGDGIENVRVVPGRDFAGSIRIRVENAGEFHQTGGGEFGVNADVILTERAGAKNGDFDFCCHAGSLKFRVHSSKFKVADDFPKPKLPARKVPVAWNAELLFGQMW
jgi:hypothetical protein